MRQETYVQPTRYHSDSLHMKVVSTPRYVLTSIISYDKASKLAVIDLPCLYP